MVFGEGILDRLPEHSSLHNTDNPFRKLFINSIGALLDDFDLTDSMEGVYLQNASNVYLDLHGKDLNVKRKHEESDEHYRNRLIYETLGYLTVDYLQNVYDLPIYAFINRFQFDENPLTSDNPYISNQYMSIADNDIKMILNNKFIIGGGILWLSSTGFSDYIIIDDVNVIGDYLEIYGKSKFREYFYGMNSITSISLNLPVATNCDYTLYGCTGLTDISLDLPAVTTCYSMLKNCSSLRTINLNLPVVDICEDMLRGCSSLINVSLDLPIVTNCDEMLRGCSSLENVSLNLPAVANCKGMFRACSSLGSVTLDLPVVTNCSEMFYSCVGLTDVVLSIPKIQEYTHIFRYCPNIETIDVTIASDKVAGFKSYVLGLNLSNLTSFIINGEEVEL